MISRQLVLANKVDTSRLAAVLAPHLQVGEVLALNGPMGAGKTTFVQQLGNALGLTQRLTSPTFVLINEYLGQQCHNGAMVPLPIAHVDLYRLGDPKSGGVGAAGMDEELSALLPTHSVWVEWARYDTDVLASYLGLSVTLSAVKAADDETDAPRHVVLTAHNARWQALLPGVVTAMAVPAV